MYASVADKNGNLLTDLPRTAFKILENNVEQQIKQLKREDIPVSLGIIIDDSGSMMNKATSESRRGCASLWSRRPIPRTKSSS